MPPETPDLKSLNIEQLVERFSSSPDRKRRGLVKSIESRAIDLSRLGPDVLKPFDPNGDDWAAGWILQVIKKDESASLSEVVIENGGWFSTPSLVGVDYGLLQEHLLSQNFEEADRFTSATLRKLAGTEAEKRGYVYFSEVQSMSGVDLLTLDRLWVAYSQARFGFSIQKRLLSALNGRYDKLWPRIGWKHDGVWTRYPNAFTWSLAAPEGHMPLINQLRGVRLMDSLLNHPALATR